MVVWHHGLNGHEFAQIPGDSKGQRRLAVLQFMGSQGVRLDLLADQQCNIFPPTPQGFFCCNSFCLKQLELFLLFATVVEIRMFIILSISMRLFKSKSPADFQYDPVENRSKMPPIRQVFYYTHIPFTYTYYIYNHPIIHSDLYSQIIFEIYIISELYLSYTFWIYNSVLIYKIKYPQIKTCNYLFMYDIHTLPAFSFSVNLHNDGIIDLPYCYC